jgi:fatty acid desaturase
MILYAVLFILGAVAMLIFRRLLVVVLRGVAMIVVVAFGGRLALIADDRLAQPNWMIGGIIGGLAAFVVVGLISYTLIYHALIRADEHRAIEKAHDDAKRRRLW